MSFDQHSFTERHTFNEVVQGTYQLAHGEMILTHFIKSEYLSTEGSSGAGSDYSQHVGFIKECRVQHADAGGQASQVVLEFWLLTTLGRGTMNLRKRAVPNSVLTAGHYLVPIPRVPETTSLPRGTITSRTSNWEREEQWGRGLVAFTITDGEFDSFFPEKDSWVVVPVVQQTFHADEVFYAYPGVLQMESGALDELILKQEELQILELAAEPFIEYALHSDPPMGSTGALSSPSATHHDLADEEQRGEDTDEQQAGEEELEVLIARALASRGFGEISKDEQVASWVGAARARDGGGYEQWEEKDDDEWEEDPEEQWEAPTFGE